MTPLEREMLAELRKLEGMIRRIAQGFDSEKLLATADNTLRLITVASAPGHIKAFPRGDYWAAYVSGSSGRPLTALCDGLGQVCLYDTELEALQAAHAALCGP